MKKKLHIISFDYPYPPKYGGVIEIFYKIKALHELGVEIILHVFYTDTLEDQKELERFCTKIYYYKRRNIIVSLTSFIPYRIQSRKSKTLLERLQKDNYPILFEGLHTTSPIMNAVLPSTFLRAHNIEHKYFFGLAKSERNLVKKISFYVEALKLKRYEKQLKKITRTFSIAPIEQDYFAKKFNGKSSYIPAFHEATFGNINPNPNKFVLWHGDLRTSDNVKSVLFLIDVYKESEFQFTIASSTKSKPVTKAIAEIKNITFVFIQDEAMLINLIETAQVHALYTFQNTGIKLKLLNALYKGKFVIGNNLLLDKTGLNTICELANTKVEFLNITEKLFSTAFTEEHQSERKKVLQDFSPSESAKKMIDIIFPSP